MRLQLPCSVVRVEKVFSSAKDMLQPIRLDYRSHSENCIKGDMKFPQPPDK